MVAKKSLIKSGNTSCFSCECGPDTNRRVVPSADGLSVAGAPVSAAIQTAMASPAAPTAAPLSKSRRVNFSLLFLLPPVNP